MRLKHFVPAVMIGAILSSPARSAEVNFMHLDQAGQSRASGFIGASISLRRSDKGQTVPVLGFGMGASPWSPSGQTAKNIIELDPAGAKGPQVYIGGRKLQAAEGDGGIGAGAIVLAVVAAAAAALLISQAGDSDDHDDEQCMIEPELCD